MDKITDVSKMRKNYGTDTFNQDNLPSKQPFALFKIWLQDAVEAMDSTSGEANAMTLSTVGENGRPSSRMVLFKGLSKTGFKFFTNYNSRKAQEIDKNSFVSLVFYWPPLHKSIRIEGTAVKLSEEESSDYFKLRPKQSQISTYVSVNQSSYIKCHQELTEKSEMLTKKFENEQVKKPEYWGGYTVDPDRIEFWCGGSNRLHSRVCFYKKGHPAYNAEEVMPGENDWVYQTLQP